MRPPDRDVEAEFGLDKIEAMQVLGIGEELAKQWLGDGEEVGEAINYGNTI